MLDVITDIFRPRQGVTRRNLLRAGFLGLGGLTLPDYLRLRAQAGTPGSSQKSVILLWQQGGPSHLETYDLKPEAPEGWRGPFVPIKTNVPGMEVCELLPQHAQIADKFTLIRSCTHTHAGHNEGTSMVMSGYGEWDENKHESIRPEIGATIMRVMDKCRDGMPVAMGMGARHYGYVASTATGYWSDVYRPPTVDRGIRDVAPIIDGTRLDDRRSLLTGLDQLRRDADSSGMLESLDEYNRQAFEVISGGKARVAFDLELEAPQTRARYGEGWGQQALLARRLVEAGVSFVTVGVPGGKEVYNWDDHAVNGDLPTAMRERLPGYDQAVTALIEDVFERGLDQQVMILVMGEFGRTPQFRQQIGTRSKVMQWGRDHWPGAMSILVSGGGKQMGQVIGKTTAKGEYPIEAPLSPIDVQATIYDHLGIDLLTHFPDNAGRPMPITRGQVIEQL